MNKSLRRFSLWSHHLWLIHCWLHLHLDWCLLLGEAAGLGASADADTDADADDDWGQDPEEEDGHKTGGGGSRSSGKLRVKISIVVQVFKITQGGLEFSEVDILGSGHHDAGGKHKEGEELVHS